MSTTAPAPSLHLERPSSGQEFLIRARGFLLENEALYNITLGSAEAPPGSPSAPIDPYWAIVGEVPGGTVQLTALHTAPRPAVLSGNHEEAARLIAGDILQHQRERNISTVLGLPASAHAFAGIIAQARSKQVRTRMRQGAYQLAQVHIPQGVEGHFRAARIEEAPQLEEWAAQFGHDAGHSDEAEMFRQSVRPRIKAQFLYLWEVRGEPVSMASLGRFTPNGAVISLVYTPQSFRGRGYGASVTAALSQHCLHTGRRYCFLYTDLDNPASNKIYRSIGYEFRAESVLLALD